MTNFEQTQRLATRWERAQHLSADGYTAYPDDTALGCYFVCNPKGELYLINMNCEVPTCTCPDWQRHQDFCKHTLFVESEQSFLEQIREIEGAEVSTGSDTQRAQERDVPEPRDRLQRAP